MTMTLLDLLLLLLTYLNTYPAILVKINFLFLFYILCTCTHSSLKLSKKYHVVRIPNTPISKVRWYNKNFITSKVYFFFYYHIIKLLYNTSIIIIYYIIILPRRFVFSVSSTLHYLFFIRYTIILI